MAKQANKNDNNDDEEEEENATKDLINVLLVEENTTSWAHVVMTGELERQTWMGVPIVQEDSVLATTRVPAEIDRYDCAQSSISSITNQVPRGRLYPSIPDTQEALVHDNQTSSSTTVTTTNPISSTPTTNPASASAPEDKAVVPTKISTESLQDFENRLLAKQKSSVPARGGEDEKPTSSRGASPSKQASQIPSNRSNDKDNPSKSQDAASAFSFTTPQSLLATHAETENSHDLTSVAVASSYSTAATIRNNMHLIPGAYAESSSLSTATPQTMSVSHEEALQLPITDSGSRDDADAPSVSAAAANSTNDTDGLALAEASLVTSPDNLQVARQVVDPKNEEKEEEEALDCNPRSRRLALLVMGCCLVIIFVVILVILFVFTNVICDNNPVPTSTTASSNNNNNNNTTRHYEGIEIQRQLAVVFGQEVFLEDDESTIPPTASSNSTTVSSITTTNYTNYHLQALDWIVHRDPLQLLPDSNHLLQRYIMALFYFQTQPPDTQKWSACNPRDEKTDSSIVSSQNQSSVTEDLCYFKHRKIYFVTSLLTEVDVVGYRWLSGQHECYWAGIQCTVSSNKVAELNLYDMNLTGSLPSELAILTNLHVISLPQNNLRGQVPSELGLIKATHVVLDFNQLTGTLPSGWLHMKSLTHLIMNYNQLSLHTLPTEIGQLTNLEELELEASGITGSLPKDIFRLTNLQRLVLRRNDLLTGTFPSEVGLLSRLEYFGVGDTLIEGTLPSDLVALTNLREFDVQGCHMTGTIPEVLYSGWAGRLSAFLLSDNEFSGTISTRIGEMQSLAFLYFRRNKFVGTIPTELGLVPDLARAALDSNSLTGSVPDEVCAHRGPNSLIRLKVDCEVLSTGEIPVFCPPVCCTKCCNQETELCKAVEEYEN